MDCQYRNPFIHLVGTALHQSFILYSIKAQKSKSGCKISRPRLGCEGAEKSRIFLSFFDDCLSSQCRVCFDRAWLTSFCILIGWDCTVSNYQHGVASVETHPTPTSWLTSLSRRTAWFWPWTPAGGGLWWFRWADSWHPRSGRRHWVRADPGRRWRRLRVPQTSWRGFGGSDQSEREKRYKQNKLESLYYFILYPCRYKI